MILDISRCCIMQCQFLEIHERENEYSNGEMWNVHGGGGEKGQATCWGKGTVIKRSLSQKMDIPDSWMKCSLRTLQVGEHMDIPEGRTPTKGIEPLHSTLYLSYAFLPSSCSHVVSIVINR
jgi:hypothetical protein